MSDINPDWRPPVPRVMWGGETECLDPDEPYIRLHQTEGGCRGHFGDSPWFTPTPMSVVYAGPDSPYRVVDTRTEHVVPKDSYRGAVITIRDCIKRLGASPDSEQAARIIQQAITALEEGTDE